MHVQYLCALKFQMRWSQDHGDQVYGCLIYREYEQNPLILLDILKTIERASLQICKSQALLVNQGFELLYPQDMYRYDRHGIADILSQSLQR